MKKNKKLVALVCCMALLVCSVGATLAWLADKTQTVTNTFTTGDIEITLTESPNELLDDEDNDEDTNSYQMIPGRVLDKDPTVTVEANSEACWLFVEVEEEIEIEGYTFDQYLTYQMAQGWNPLDGETGVFYREVAENAENQVFDVIGYMDGETFVADKILVNPTVTATMMEKAEAANPTLSFTAYAVQKENINTPAEAWAQAKNAQNY